MTTNPESLRDALAILDAKIARSILLTHAETEWRDLLRSEIAKRERLASLEQAVQELAADGHTMTSGMLAAEIDRLRRAIGECVSLREMSRETKAIRDRALRSHRSDAARRRVRIHGK